MAEQVKEGDHVICTAPGTFPHPPGVVEFVGKDHVRVRWHDGIGILRFNGRDNSGRAENLQIVTVSASKEGEPG